MKALVTGLLVLVVSVLLALLVKQDNGYVLIGYKQWSIEGSLAFFLLLNLILLAALHLFSKLVARIWGIPGKLHGWQDQRSAVRARQELTQGLVEMSEGHWKRAEKNLVRHAERSETPLLNYLAAARSAQQQGAHERRDHYLQLAHESVPDAEVAVGLTQAELQLGQDQLEQALATLRHLRHIAPRHTHVLKLLADLYQRVGDWRELERLLPELKKRRVINQAEIRQLELKVFCNLLNKAACSSDRKALECCWNALAPALKQSTEMILLYAGHLKQRGEYDKVASLLKGALERNWDDALIECYGSIDASNKALQLSTAESWLEDHSSNPVLLLALGRLSMRNRLWGKAVSYLEASIGAQANAPAHRELGALLEKMGEQQLAIAHFKSAIELSGGSPLPELPESLASQGQLESRARQVDHPTDINPPRLEVVGEKKI